MLYAAMSRWSAVWMLFGGTAVFTVAACGGSGTSQSGQPKTAQHQAAPAAPTQAPREAQPNAAASSKSEAAPAIPPPLPNTGKLLSRSEIKKVVRASYPTMTKCFEEGLSRDPSMQGRIDVMLAIADEGEVVRAAAQGNSQGNSPGNSPGTTKRSIKSDDLPALTDPAVRKCVERHFQGLRFPPTNRGIINLVYPVEFSVE